MAPRSLDQHRRSPSQSRGLAIERQCSRADSHGTSTRTKNLCAVAALTWSGPLLKLGAPVGEDEEELAVWADVLDQVAARRAEPISCPHCGVAPLAVEQRASGITRISCTACRRFIEGRFGA
jgi:hypothetical protein